MFFQNLNHQTKQAFYLVGTLAKTLDLMML